MYNKSYMNHGQPPCSLLAMKKTFLLISLAALLFASCRKEPVEFTNPNNRYKTCKSYVQQFEAVWQGMNQGYMFWEVDTVDWDARYAKYLPVFQKFDADPSKVVLRDWYDAWEGLFDGLLDHHLTAYVWIPRFWNTWTISPGSIEVYSRDYYHWTNRDAQIAALKKLDTSNYCGFDPAYVADQQFAGSYFCLLPGKKGSGKKIAYFRLTNFMFMEHAGDAWQYLGNHVEDYERPLREFFGNYTAGMNRDAWPNRDEVESIIIDVRGNGGGSTADLNTLMGALTQSPTHVGYTRVKEGLGRLDYSAWTAFRVNTPGNHLMTSKPIVVLADVNSVSCAELTTMLIKNLPNGTFIGERTYGAVGALMPDSERSHDMFYNGCFGNYYLFENGEAYNNTNFEYYVYTSNYHFVDVNKEAVEGRGIIPDIEVAYDAEKLSRGIDVQLNKALDFLRK